MGALDTRVAIVTGGGSGIGRATAFALAAEGAVVAVVDRDEPGAADTVNAITASGGEACSYTADVSDPAAVTAFVDDTVRRFGGLDIAFNNAGSKVRRRRPASAPMRTGRGSSPSTSPEHGCACGRRSRTC
jgi:NAD(P)-dependent dehydrogenase (short-subunit alcohol dehydrogenase family)